MFYYEVLLETAVIPGNKFRKEEVIIPQSNTPGIGQYDKKSVPARPI